MQGSLDNSTPLYLTSLISEGSEIALNSSESGPVLQFPGTFPLLDFSFGAGQILVMQLLNSWNRHVRKLIGDITAKQNSAGKKTNSDANQTLAELQDLIFHKGINEKISVNYLRALEDLVNPSRKTFLYELPIPPDETSQYSSNPEKYGLEKPGPIISNIASIILKSLDLNEKHLLDVTSLRKSKIDVLKIKEDREYSRKMLCLTIVIATATIINIILFLARML